VREFRVRASAAEDVDEITRIYQHYVLHSCSTFEIEPPKPEEMARRRLAILQARFPYLTCEENGRVIGYAYANAYRPREAYRYTVEDSIYVSPEAAGQGCGGALMASLIAECEKGPWRQMLAVIGDGGNVASIALHRRFGFREVGTLERVGYKFDRWVDTVLMQRELNTLQRREA
jgi:phosphinothricin acetyltransferase